jgi:pyruvate dehydrogenase E1 component alpha subunit
LHKLPVLFVCENNLYSVNTPLEARQPSNRTITELTRGHGIPAFQHDGQMVETVYSTSAEAVAHIRAGKGPILLEYFTYRWLEHCGPLEDIHLGYRTQQEFDAWMARCPLRLSRRDLENSNVLDEAAHAVMDSEIAAEIDDAVSFARASPFPNRAELSRHIYA